MISEIERVPATVGSSAERPLEQRAAGKSEPVRKLQAAIDSALRDRIGLRVLEAGCGSSTHIDLGPSPYMAGIDISAQQLQRNQVLDQKILGDVETYKLPASDFDVIICWDVLEHLSHPEKALKNFVRTAKEDGLIILAVPNLWSIKGLITKLTPYPIHVWAWRVLFGAKDAGRNDNGPFRTYLRRAVGPQAIIRFARKQGLVVEYFDLHESPNHQRVRAKYGLTGRRLAFIRSVIGVLSAGKVAVELTDCFVVLRKPTSGARRAG